MLLWALWWTFDDHLAEAMMMPGVGTLPIWVPLLVAISIFPISLKYKGA